MQTDHGLRPDLVFFTGDIAFGVVDGESMTDQYNLVRDFFDAVRKAYDPEIPIRDIYLVPGNHDVDRDEITPDQTTWLRHPDRKLAEVVDAMGKGQKQWKTWMERLLSYRHFLTSYGLLHLVPEDPHLIWADAREIHGTRVGIAGLNSAWSCANKEEKGKLWFGADWQIAQVKERMGPVAFEFVLMHHPGNWFTAQEDPYVMRRLRQDFAIVLHGHEHQEWVEFDRESRLILSAGASYESSWMANGYSIGYVDLDKHNGGIRLRQWDRSGRGWVPRNIAGKTKDGLWPLSQISWINRSASDVSAELVSLLPEVSLAVLSDSAEENYTRRFCQHVIDQHDVLELFGCDISRELQRHQLSVAYVSLNLAREDEDEDEALCCIASDDQEIKAIKEQVVSVCKKDQRDDLGASSTTVEFVLDKVSASNRRLLINGPAGAGKSTLMRWCAIHAAQQRLPLRNLKKSRVSDQYDDIKVSDDSDSWRLKIPLLIRLRDCPTGRLPAVNDLPKFLAKHLPSAPSDWMTDVFDSGQALVLFDGVDEIHPDQRRQLAEEIAELIRTYPDCIYVVTTRPGAVESGWLARLDFIEAHVEAMSRRDREEFIDKWYCSAALELRQRPRPGENLTLTASKLKAELVEQPELGMLATNPLLCAMICALYRERQEKLPETSAELSEALCHILLDRRERETPGLDGKHFLTCWRALQYQQKKGLLAEIAWDMVKKGESSVDTAVARALVAESLNSTPGRSKEEAADVVQSLVERSGLLRPAGDDRIDFLHNSLKEYLAAGRFVEEGDWKILADHADDPAVWQSVILFSLAIAPESFSSSLVRKLLSRVEKIKIPVKTTGNLSKREKRTLAQIKARQFFLVRCRAAAKRLAADCSTAIDVFFKNLLPPSSMNEVLALAQLGPRILSYGTATLENSEWWARQTCQMVARCLRLLRFIGGQRARSILKTIRRLPDGSSTVNNEWLLACCELVPQERLSWPYPDNNSIFLTLSSSAINDITPLDGLTSLRHLTLWGTSVSDLNPIGKLKNLEGLNITRNPIMDLEPLAGMVSLEYLCLDSTPVSDLRPLQQLKSLEYLDLDRTRIVDLEPLADMMSLKSLRFDGTQVSDLNPIRRLESLEDLSMNRTGGVDLEPLAGMVLLKYLHLDNTPVSNLSSLRRLEALESLSLARTQVADLAPLAGMLSLKYLYLEGTPVSDLSPLRCFELLEHLNLEGTRVVDLEPLADMAALKDLRLVGVQVRDFNPLREIASLKRIYISEATLPEEKLKNFRNDRPDVIIIPRKYLKKGVVVAMA